MAIAINKAQIFVISGASGVGKSSLVSAICAKKDLFPQLQLSVSHTTRPMRRGEIDGKDYFFISNNEFQQMLENKEFLEHAKVYDYYYGTNIKTINSFIKANKSIILEIDWQGAYQIKQLLPEAVLIYINPPSLDELTKRLEKRGTDSKDTIKKRLLLAKEDISHSHKFDYLLTNYNFNDTLQDLCSIIMELQFKDNLKNT